MTLKEYITQRFQSFGIQLSEADLLDISLQGGVELDGVFERENLAAVSVGIAKFIPFLFLRATSISENGFSMSWNQDGLRQYYAYLCRAYGLKDDINTDKPKIAFL